MLADHLLKTKKEYKETGDTKDIYRSELDKTCFQHDMAYNIAKNPRCDGYQRGLASMVYKLFDKKTASLTDESAVGSGIKSMFQNEQLAEELHKPIIIKFKKAKVYSAFKDNIWISDLADMQLISKFNKVLLTFLANMHGLFL